MQILVSKTKEVVTKKAQVLLLATGLVFASVTATAQTPDQNQMMAQMMEMQQCFQSIDQSEINALQQRALELQRTIKSLCQQGNDSKATQQAMAFGTEIANSQTVKKIRQCTEKMAEAIKNIPIPNPMAAYEDFDRDYSDTSICEEI